MQRSHLYLGCNAIYKQTTLAMSALSSTFGVNVSSSPAPINPAGSAGIPGFYPSQGTFAMLCVYVSYAICSINNTSACACVRDPTNIEQTVHGGRSWCARQSIINEFYSAISSSPRASAAFSSGSYSAHISRRESGATSRRVSTKRIVSGSSMLSARAIRIGSSSR